MHNALFKDLICSVSSTLEGSTFNFPFKKAVNEITNSPVFWDGRTSSGDGGGIEEKGRKEGKKTHTPQGLIVSSSFQCNCVLSGESLSRVIKIRAD